MKKIKLKTSLYRLPADLYTPVGIYLKLRDRFRDTILLESTDHHASENSFSFIGINAIGGIEVKNSQEVELKYPGASPVTLSLNDQSVQRIIWNYMGAFEVSSEEKDARYAQGLFGYTAYDAIPFFETVAVGGKGYDKVDELSSGEKLHPVIPLIRYRLYQFVIVVDHFKDSILLLENSVEGVEGDAEGLIGIITGKNSSSYPFATLGDEQSNMSDDEYLDLVRKGIGHCYRGDVFQIVLSRRFQQQFKGDEFNVYRALRMVNPSPYLFYFDYGDYKLMGSSPESQLIVANGKAVVHPIAGTFKRTGDDATDHREAERLLLDPKENAEHVMLVDLARNDLSRACSETRVDRYRQVKYYSHVIHLVSEVTASVNEGMNPIELIATTFPAGTLSGAPKFKAMELIERYEPSSRSFYGGAIGFFGFNGTCNHAILIRSFMSKGNTLYYQAGAGIVASSVPESELQEVNNKLGALKKALAYAQSIRHTLK
ncbi:MAG: anthranilate synthase component I family protein [Chitinophagaceae bacterium]|jgi:anthranilate synthase component 1